MATSFTARGIRWAPLVVKCSRPTGLAALRRLRLPRLHDADYDACVTNPGKDAMATKRWRESGASERAILVVVGLIASIATIAWLALGTLGDAQDAGPASPPSFADRTGSIFLPAPANPTQPPTLERLSLPAVPGGQAIWGATGRDREGGIWFGVSVSGSRERSAHLLRYDPATRSWSNRGNAIDQLRRSGLYRNGMGQVKIHSRIVTADDGWLYFASSDEDGENADGQIPPRWGGHLWRMRSADDRWQHVLAVPEGLVAAGAAGRYVYALGYWGHVLHQYDTRTGTSRRVAVGSVGGHVSRNFLSAVNGHAWVPRVQRGADGTFSAELVEFDGQLQEIARTPLEFYLGKGAPDSNHGITGIATLSDGRLAFTTARGHLYLVEPNAQAPAKVEAVGWFHPDGERYAPSLFAYGGANLLAGVTQRGSRFDWVVYELITRTSMATTLDTSALGGALLYGSVTRDNAGGSYLVGWAEASMGSPVPLALRLTPGP